MPSSYVTCRVQSGRGVQCTAEAVDPDAELKICTRHLAEAMRLIERARRRAPKGEGES
ncbi:hypothetical protein [Streptomyces cupreus]|uniref:Uncharacterized protein n=1 Tax=Streptomyces cupreus TaxID=2759956 RepID=A0A7X1J4F8_9ACTN|nr:hypothetical protein [Streptomyces cupreus]MBC2904008.1 hypothetical protein [Streptomyces cupreus]